VLSPAARSYLEELPLEAVSEDGLVTVAHGSLEDPAEYVLDKEAGLEQLARLAERRPGARVLVLGHTHHPLECALEAGPSLHNPGSVGQSRERHPVARAMVLDPERGRARRLAVEYNVAATRRELREAGLPPHACHLAPGRRARLKRRLAARRGRRSATAPRY
jgi:diadenosine tetraphosphatase ApaH/serine/threonine PP2A family protein phosphatase